MRGKLAMRAGFAARSRRRRAAAIAACRRRIACPAAASYSRSRAVQRFPGLRRQGLTGAAVWYDYVTTEAGSADVLLRARRGRARRRAGEPRRGRSRCSSDGKRVTGVRARDTLERAGRWTSARG